MSNALLNLTTYPAIVGAVVRHIRTERGHDQAQAAAHLGVTPSSYSRLELGRSVFTVTQISQLCRLFDISSSDLFARVEQARAAVTQMGVRVSDEREPDYAGVIVNIIIGAALVGLVASILSGE